MTRKHALLAFAGLTGWVAVGIMAIVQGPGQAFLSALVVTGCLWILTGQDKREG